MTEDLTVDVQIHCPVCSKRGKISVEENILVESVRGITAINIAPDLVCEHSFVAYIDKNLDVRDCFVCDFKVELPEISMKEAIQPKIKEDFSIDVIKINLFPTLMINILRGALHGKKIGVLYETEFVRTQLSNFFAYVMDEAYKAEILFFSRSDFKNNKKEYKDYIILDGSKIVQDKEKFLLKKKLKIENIIVQKFYSEFDSKSSLIIFKNEIQKSYRLAEQLIEFNEKLKEGEEFNTKGVFDYLTELYRVKIPFDYIGFLTEVIENYFKVKLKKPSDSADLLYFL